MIESLKRQGVLKSKAVEDALSSVPREEFVWKSSTPISLSYIDEPLPLGSTGQTMSAPDIVVMMLEELELEPGHKVLEIGTGSGYNAALITKIVSGNHKADEGPLVISVERNPDLARFARDNLQRVGLSGLVLVVEGDGSLGYPQQSTEEIYDRTIVTAGAPRVPMFLKKQLKIGGVLVAPIGGTAYQRLVKLHKLGKDKFSEQKLIECMFVPLIGEDAHKF